MKGCLGFVGIVILLAVLLSIVSTLHGHFDAHEQAIILQQKNAAEAQQAEAEATAAAIKADEARKAHEQRLAWQKAHPAEYARQEAQQRAAALQLEQQHIAAARAAQRAAAAAAAAEAAARARVTPEPTPESFEAQRQREKHEFYETVDQSVTAENIAGNPTKYVGTNVELHCTVSNVPQEGIVNASCGADDTNIVLEYNDTKSLDQGQAVRVLGTVDDPQAGTNAMGGAMNFPTVKVQFME